MTIKRAAQDMKPTSKFLEKQAEHTPGPWHHNGHCAIESKDRYVGSTDSHGANDEVMDQANARLIAAAPEGYELARTLMEWDKERWFPVVLTNMARTLIAKVERRT